MSTTAKISLEGGKIGFVQVQCWFTSELRMIYLECKLFLDGEFNANVIVGLGISRQQAYVDINKYRSLFEIPPFHYDDKLKLQILDRRRKPILISREKMPEFVRMVESLNATANRAFQKYQILQ